MSQVGQYFSALSPSSFVTTLTGNSGGPVPPTGGNINVVGDGTTINVVGNPGTSTLTISTTGSIPDIFNADSGSATPLLGIIVMAGGTGINTSAAGHTVTYNLDVPVSIAHGGTNATSMATTDGVVYFDGTRLVTTAVGTAGEVLTSNGTGVAPTYQPAASSGIITIDGDVGSVTGSTITITGGTSGAVFTGSGTILTESFNFLSMPTSTSSTTGVIDLGGVSFMHNYGALADDNVFLGSAAGNFTMTPGTAILNVGIGANALHGLTVGLGNTAIGHNAMTVADTATTNTCVGFQSLFSLLGGASNVSVGFNSLLQLTTGQVNLALGQRAGINYTGAESSNILLNNDGTTGESNTLRIGAATGTGTEQINQTFICGINGINVGSVASVVAINGDQLGSTVITAGSGISVTPGANTITIASTGGGMTTIDGDSGSVTGSTVTLTGGSSGSLFSGSGTTMTMTTNYINFPSSTSTSTTAGVIAFNGTVYLSAHNSLTNAFICSSAGNFGLTGSHNIGIGDSALNGLTGGSGNIGIGENALTILTSGIENVVIGRNIMTTATTDSTNIGIGNACLQNLNGGANTNVAIGNNALNQANGSSSNNIGIGNNALNAMTFGASFNTAVGESAGNGIASGASHNLFLGFDAGTGYAGGESSNILLQSTGSSGENNTLRIGQATGTGTANINQSFICGINGITVTGTAVLVSSSDQLGIAVSSAKYKENIKTIDYESSQVMLLRPIAFNYKDDPQKTKSFGLIAEEVNEILPELVITNKDKEPLTIKYQELPILILNELQRLAARVWVLEQKLARQGEAHGKI